MTVGDAEDARQWLSSMRTHDDGDDEIGDAVRSHHYHHDCW